MLAGGHVALAIHQIHPQSMQVHRVLHHGFVLECDTNAFAVVKFKRAGVTELHVINRPEISFHIAGET